MKNEAAHLRPHADEYAEPAHAPWRTALLPVLMILGIILPLTFLTRIEQYLHYLRPIELLPTYATAWLVLAAVSALPFVTAAMALKLLHLCRLERLGHLAAVLLFWIGATAAISAVLFDIISWLWTFTRSAPAGVESTAEFALVAVSMALAIPLAISHRNRDSLQALQTTAVIFAVLGGLCTLSLPFFQWDAGTTYVPVSDLSGNTAASLSRPHILLVTIDALSAEQMSLYGARRPTTPSLDEFARGAAVFDRAYANANFTTPGVSSILTGTRPWSHRAFQIFSWPTAATRRTSLPALLARAGYQTGYVATNSFAGASRIGLGPYFSFGRSDQVPMELSCPDSVAAVLPYECAAAQIPALLGLQKSWNRVQESFAFWRANRYYDPALAIQAALTWLDGVDKRRPVFLWLHVFPPHAPYAAPYPWLGHFDASPEARDATTSDPEDNYVFGDLAPERVQVLEARYDESVQYVDHYVGEFLLEALKTLGDNTVVVVTADHGESFAHGYGGHGGPGLFDSIIHVPLIIRLPHQSHSVRIVTPVEQVDIAPTLAQLAGISPPPLWEGRPLQQLLERSDTGPIEPPRPVFAMNFEENASRSALTTGAIAIIEGRWKLIHYMGALHYPQIPRLHDELYDLVGDPGETVNRVSEEPREVEHLRRVAASKLAEYGNTSQ